VFIVRKRTTVVLMLAALIGAGALAAAPAVAQSHGLPFEVGAAVFTPDAPTIDGDLSDAAWTRALPMAPFQTLTLHQIADVQTTGYMLHDASTLYIGVRCDEPEPGRIKATVDKRDGPTYLDDCIEIFLVPPDSPILARFEERVQSFHLVVNALGTMYDEIGLNSPEAFTADWRAAAKIGNDDWTLEVAIPFAAFGVDVKAGDVWRGNISRSRTPKAAYTTWAPLERTFHDRANFGQIVFTRDAAATAEQIEALEFGALMDGLLRPRMATVGEELDDLQDDAAELPRIARPDAMRMTGRLVGRWRNMQFGLARLTEENFREDWPSFEGRLAQLERDAGDAAGRAARAGAQEIDVDVLMATGAVELDRVNAASAAQSVLAAEGGRGTVDVGLDTVTVFVQTDVEMRFLSVVGLSGRTVAATRTARAAEGVVAG